MRGPRRIGSRSHEAHDGTMIPLQAVSGRIQDTHLRGSLGRILPDTGTVARRRACLRPQDLKRRYGLPAAGSTTNQVSYGETLRQPETDCSRQDTEIQ
jgi:hypothetical protein